MSTTNEKLSAFAALLQDEQRKRYIEQYPKSVGVTEATEVKVHHAKRYIRVDVGTSGRFMIERETGEIFGIKGYGVIHRGHRYGTLDTINEWHWGEYYPLRKQVAA